MAYMSKTKKKRIRMQRLLGLVITVVVIVGVLVAVWQIGLGSTLATVNGSAIRSSEVKGMTMFLDYYQNGTFTTDANASLTGDAKTQADDAALINQNNFLINVFVPLEVLKQHFKAEGTVFPNSDNTTQINTYVDQFFSNTDTAKLFSSHGVKKAYVEAYFEYTAAMSVYKDEVVAADPVTDADMQTYYDAHIDYFTTPLSIQASHILISDPNHTFEKRTEAQSLLDQLNSGADFAEMAKEHSDDSATASNGGDLGTFHQGDKEKAFEDACLALQPGDISGVVETTEGYEIIKLTSKTDAAVSPLSDVKDTVSNYVASERVAPALDSLVQAADVQYKGLINPTTGKPPITQDELAAARNPGGSTDATGTGTDTGAASAGTDTSATDTSASADTGSTDTSASADTGSTDTSAATN